MQPLVKTLAALVAVLGLSIACSSGEPSGEADVSGLTEASMNFDLDWVGPFLSRLTTLVEGFGDAEVRQLSESIAEIPVESERSWDFMVRYQGAEVPLRVRAFMDDIDAPDLYFFTSPQLASAIQRELRTYAESLGM
jgi:hypothetical protein